MAYSKYYPEGWKDNEEGGTPINAEALNNMESGIAAAHAFMERTDNPHKVTKAQVGLGNAENTADIAKNVNSAKTLTTPRTLDGVSFNGGANITHYGTCSTDAATTAKTVTCAGFTLAAGARITVKFTVTNTGAVGSLTLNVNGTGAKSIKYRGGNLPAAGTLAAGRVYAFMYDGTNYELVGDLDSDTTYTSKVAASGGTEVSLVTTGEKATWNAKTSNTGTITKVQANGTDVASSGVANIPAATTAKYGVTQLSSATNSASEALAATPKAVKAAYDLANSKTSNTGTVTKISTGVGLTGGDITGTGTVKAKLKTETAHTLDSAAQTNTASRQYAVGVDKSGYLSVNVPWTDTNTWRGIQNNLTSDSTADSLSAAQGKALANGSARDSTKLPLAGGTMTGDLLFSDSGTNTRQIRFAAGSNDYGRIAVGATETNAGFLEIASADDGNEPIYVRQYTGTFATLKRTATILDANGNTSFPGTVTANGATLTSNAPASAAPLMDGTAAVGTSAKYAREDHRHPVDTSRASAADLNALVNYIKSTDIYRTASGNPVTFRDGYAANVKELVVTLTPTQEGEGDPSPDNIRPISGVSSVSVTRTGKNLWGGAKMIADIDAVSSWCAGWGIANREAGGIIKMLTTNTVQQLHDPNEPKFLKGAFKADTRYAFVYKSMKNKVSGALDWAVFYTDGTIQALPRTPVKSDEWVSDTFVTAAGKSVDYITTEWSSGYVWLSTEDFGIFEGDAPPSAFEACQAQSVTVPIVDSNGAPLTVYGGTLNVTTGVLTVDRAFGVLTSSYGSNRFKLTTGSNIYAYRLEKNALFSALASDRYACSHYKSSNDGWRELQNGCCRIIDNHIGICDSRFTTIEEANAWLDAQKAAGTPVTICYKIAPVTYRLTPAQIAALSGYNSVSADAGTLAVQYRADPSISLGGG